MRRLIPAALAASLLLVVPATANQSVETLTEDEVVSDVAVMIRCSAVTIALRDSKILASGVLLRMSSNPDLDPGEREKVLASHRKLQVEVLEHTAFMGDLQTAFAQILREARGIGMNTFQMSASAARDTDALAGRIRERMMDGTSMLPFLIEMDIETEECREWQRDLVNRDG